MNEQEREDCGEDAPEFARIVRIAEAACAEAGGVKLAATPAPAPEAESLQEQLDEALSSLDFYKRRSAALQACQHMMRDPERTMVCDILANGSLLINGKGELAPERYAPAQAQQAAEPYGYLRQTSSAANPPHGWAFHFAGKPGDVAVYLEAKAKPEAQQAKPAPCPHIGQCHPGLCPCHGIGEASK